MHGCVLPWHDLHICAAELFCVLPSVYTCMPFIAVDPRAAARQEAQSEAASVAPLWLRHLQPRQRAHRRRRECPQPSLLSFHVFKTYIHASHL